MTAAQYDEIRHQMNGAVLPLLKLQSGLLLNFSYEVSEQVRVCG